MSSKTKGQKHAPVEPITRSAIQGFIEISPNFFNSLFEERLHKVDFIMLRDIANKYKNGPEYVWGPSDEDEEMEASIYFHEDNMEKFIYIPRKARLYCSDDIMKIAALITDLRAHEALKVIV